MKTKDKELQILEANEVCTNWRKGAEWRQKNKYWLKYSRFIALKVLHRLDEVKMTQRHLAEQLNCSPQYVSKLLKGNANMTLETISKLEDLLKIDLVKSSLSFVRGYEVTKEPVSLVAEPEAHYGKSLD